MGLHVDVFAAFLAGGEHYYAVDEGEEGVILTDTHVQTGMMLCAALALQDIAGLAVGAAEYLHSQSFAF